MASSFVAISQSEPITETTLCCSTDRDLTECWGLFHLWCPYEYINYSYMKLDIMGPRQNHRCFADDIVNSNFLDKIFDNKFHWNLFRNGPINNKPALVYLSANETIFCLRQCAEMFPMISNTLWLNPMQLFKMVYDFANIMSVKIPKIYWSDQNPGNCSFMIKALNPFPENYVVPMLWLIRFLAKSCRTNQRYIFTDVVIWTM